MSDELKSYLTFEEYSVSEMEFKRNYSFDKDKKIGLNFAFDGSADISEHHDEAWLELTCRIFENEFSENKAPFYMKLTMMGKFGLNVNNEDLDIKNFQLNGLAILLPHLRSLITSFTSQSGMPPVILPAINVYNAFEMIESNQKDA